MQASLPSLTLGFAAWLVQEPQTCTINLKTTKIMEATIRNTQFAALAIGATARHMGITATELHNRLKRHGLVKRLLLDCYDTLHTESIDGVVWNVEQALKNWDMKEGGQR